MEVQLVTLREAAAILGRTPQGLRQRRARGTLLADGTGTNPRLLVVDGQLVEGLADAAAVMHQMAARIDESQSAQQALADRLAEAEEKAHRLAGQLQLAEHELELERHRTAVDLRSMAQAMEATARVISERVGRA